MIPQIIKREDLERELEKTGVDKEAFDIFDRKSDFILAKLSNVNAKGANILKQEFIGAGGDVAVHRDVASWKVEKTDCVLMGTKRTFLKVYEKLAFEPFFGLTEVRNAIKLLLEKNALPVYKIAGKTFDFNKKKFLMGILNVTPDSFSDGGLYANTESALKHAEKMLEEGADIIDIGGESTRPGAEKVDAEEEKRRVIPVISEIRKQFPDAMISIDTYKAEVAEKAIKAGANIINDISGLRFDEKMKFVAKEYDVPVIVMHIKGTPKDMQKNPFYEDVIRELLDYFEERINTLESFGINKIIIDPGIGFGKRVSDNLKIIKNLKAFTIFKKPVLLGLSRKSFIGAVTGENVENRLHGTLVSDTVGVLNGANILRVHDVKPHKELLQITEAISNA